MKLSKLLGQTVIYGLSSILGRTLNYLLVPLYTTIFSEEEYGVVTELYAYVAFLNIIFTYGLETTLFRFASKEDENLNDNFNLAQSSILFTTLILGGMIFLLAPNIANALEYPDQANLVQWIAVILSVDAFVALFFARLRLEGRAIKFATLKLSNILLNIGLNLFFLILCPYFLENGYSWPAKIYIPQLGVGYVFLSNMLANVSYLLFFSRSIFKFKISFNWPKLKGMLNYAFPLMILGLAGVTNEMLSRSILKYRLPENFYEDMSRQAALGVFGACYKLSIFMVLAVQAFKYAYEPVFFKKSVEKDSKEFYAKTMNSFIIFGCISWVLISLVLPELAPIFLRQSGYLRGLQIVPLLLGGGLFLGIYFNLSVWYKLSDNNWSGATISIIGAILTIVLNLALIPIMGFMGSAWTSIVSYGSMMIISFVWGQKVFHVPYRMISGIAYILIAFASILVLSFIEMTIFMRYVVGISSALIITLIAFVFKGKQLRSI